MLIQADARALPLQDGCVQCVVTSPPYFGLRDYGIAQQIGLEASPDAYVAALVDVFREVRRVLTADGVSWLNLGDSYNSAFGQGTGPARARSETRKQTDGRLRGVLAGMKPKDLMGIPWRVAFALQANGWYLRSAITWCKGNPMPESVRDRPTKATEMVFLLAKSERYFYNSDAVRAKGSGHNMRDWWVINSRSFTGAHFATMPEALVEPCILAGSRLGDLILDPFSGSGTVLAVAERTGRRSVGVDLNPAYHRLAKARTAQRGLRFVSHMRTPTEERGLVCVTCDHPILVTDEWSWLDTPRRQPEHDRCYAERFARQFPAAQKRGK